MKKISNYYYQFELIKEGEKPSDILKKLDENITLSQFRISEDYTSLKKKIAISAISENSAKKMYYRANITKFHYGFKSHFIDKDIDFSSFKNEEENYGRDSGKKNNESEEVHFYCCMKFGISFDGKCVKGIISVPRIREGITTKEVHELLKKLFESVFGKGYYRKIRPAYCEKTIRDLFGNATEINFTRNEESGDFFAGQIAKTTGMPMVKVRSSISDEKSISNLYEGILNIFKGAKDEELKKEMGALHDLSIVTPCGTYDVDNNDFKLRHKIEVSDYINTMSITDRDYFTDENIKFIDKSFNGFFQ